MEGTLVALGLIYTFISESVLWHLCLITCSIVMTLMWPCPFPTDDQDWPLAGPDCPKGTVKMDRLVIASGQMLMMAVTERWACCRCFTGKKMRWVARC